MKTLAGWTIQWLLLLVVPFTGISTAQDCQSTPQYCADFSDKGWVDAFDSMHAKFSVEYAFTDWKGIDWPALRTEFRPLVVQAQADSDEAAFYMAMRRYAFSVPDGHISLSAEELDLKRSQVGGGFGLAAAELDDGTITAYYVVPGGPAGQAGVEAGAEIVQWGAQQASQALEQVSTIWGANAATDEHRRLQQLQFLTRAPVGATVQLVYRNPVSTVAGSTALVAVDDSFATLEDTGFARPSELIPVIQPSLLSSGYGYVKVTAEAPMAFLLDHFVNQTSYTEPEAWQAMEQEFTQPFRTAIADFIAKDVPGVVLDIRGNHGGSEPHVAVLAGSFYGKAAFQEKHALYEVQSGTFLVDDDAGILIEPHDVRYTGPVIVLVNPMTISSGEGIARNIQRLPDGIVVGFYGTNGSYGITGGEMTLPGGYTLSYPIGRALDEDGSILLDSRTGTGGVQPDVRIPRTADRLVEFGKGTDVALEYAVQTFGDYPWPASGTDNRSESPGKGTGYPAPSPQIRT